jgi:hypothetical protein
VDGRAFEGHWGPLRPPRLTQQREMSNGTVCRDMTRGGSKGCGRISLALLAPAHNRIDLPAAALRTDKPIAPIENRGADIRG